ncbi:hypothetical protein GCM10010336_53660 [Streptomyces goshikiensis]|nr:hypothetical protein GCM10010336_53660 [Streptomyces goshikiensis]
MPGRGRAPVQSEADRTEFWFGEFTRFAAALAAEAQMDQMPAVRRLRLLAGLAEGRRGFVAAGSSMATMSWGCGSCRVGWDMKHSGLSATRSLRVASDMRGGSSWSAWQRPATGLRPPAVWEQ